MSGLSSPGKAAVDLFWSKQMGCHPDELDSSTGVAIGPDLGREYVHLLRRGQGLRISCSASMMSLVTDVSLKRDPTTLFDVSTLTSTFEASIETLIGPTYLGYLDRVEPSSDSLTRAVSAVDHDALRELRSSVSETEWDHSGLSIERPLVGYFRASQLLSAAGYNILDEAIAHVGVLTRQEARGRGLGRLCVRGIVERAVSEGLVAQYQTLYSNTSAISIARGLGFVHYGDRIFVRAK